MATESLMNVRCCGIGKNGEFECVTPKNSEGSCPKSEAKSYGQAQKLCKMLGKELCTKEQLDNGLCCGTGCGFDGTGVWIVGSDKPWCVLANCSKPKHKKACPFTCPGPGACEDAGSIEF